MIRIITDSTCEAPPEVLNHPAVVVIPLSVVFGKNVLRDGIEITREEFWRRLPTSDPLPTTSQAIPADYIGLLKQFTAAGDEVIIITLSAKLSGTYNSAVIAAESQVGWPVSVIDSQSISIGLGLMVQQALALVDAGASRAEIVAKLTRMASEIRVIFVLETLEYLQRGGRIGKAQAFVGTLLKFKPLLAIVNGEVVPVARVRSRTKALQAVQETLLAQVGQRGPQVRLALTQAVASEEAQVVGDLLAASFETARPFIADLGPVIGVHVGPGTVGVAVYAGD